jgi:salicylate hydroxylase
MTDSLKSKSGAIQTASMAVEDAAVLGKLFAHLSNEEQIRHFLYAFQELRQARCSIIAKQEISIIHFGTLPNGEHQAARDAVMRNKTMRGLGVFEGDDRATLTAWEENTVTFGYDAEDDADNWWVQWGSLRERARCLALAHSNSTH